jgi:hypothetical protein
MTNAEQYGFWAMLLYIFVRDGIIPILNKILPAKVEQAAQKQEREIAVGEREATALEQISKAITVQNERMSQMETGQNAMIQTLHAQSEALAILVDRKRAERRTGK